MDKRRLYILIAIIGFIFLNLVQLLFSERNENPKIAEQAPDFQAQSMDEQIHRLSELQGKVVLLNFWATWCGPCEREMPSLEALSQRYQGKDFVVLGLSLDESGIDDVRAFVKKYNLTFPIWLDHKFEIANQYGLKGVPMTFLLSKEGRVLQKISGPQHWDKKNFWRMIDQALAQERVR